MVAEWTDIGGVSIMSLFVFVGLFGRWGWLYIFTQPQKKQKKTIQPASPAQQPGEKNKLVVDTGPYVSRCLFSKSCRANSAPLYVYVHCTGGPVCWTITCAGCWAGSGKNQNKEPAHRDSITQRRYTFHDQTPVQTAESRLKIEHVPLFRHIYIWNASVQASDQGI